MINDVIKFEKLGIELHVGKSIEIFGVEIAYYGIIIGIGMLLGLMIALWEAKRTNQNTENYIDFLITVVLIAIAGARLYYVIFEWDYYKDHLGEIIDIREGGLAIYGGVIAAVITMIVFTKKRKLSFGQMADTGCMGLILGQAIGRWGNFCNREAFGGYYTGLFSMQIPVSEANGITDELLSNAVNGFISVHPTFLYESLWNIIGLGVLMLYARHKKNHGEVLALYFTWYGIGRAMIEGLRTDQLTIGNTGIAASQVLSVLLAIGGIAYIIRSRVCIQKTDLNE